MTYSASASDDHIVRGLARFLEQFKNKKNINALAASYLHQIQEFENACWEVILFRLLDNAEGVQLDTIGRIVGRGRGELIDSDYKIAIRAQIRINRSCGTPNDLIDVMVLSIPTNYSLTYDEAYPATVIMSIVGIVNFNISVVFDNLRRTKSGGVRLLLSYSSAAPENTFTFASGSVPELDNLQGYGSITDVSVGGLYSGVLASSP